MAQEPKLGVVAAWLVHGLTASGAILAMLALFAIAAEDFRLALLWLGLALVIDGVDGTLARWAHVKTRLPRIDGDALDLIVDFLNYVFIPTIFMWQAGLIPASTAPLLAAAIQISSLYVFARRDMKTEDHYFRGFPALWNLVAFYLFVSEPGASVGGWVVAVLVVLTFAPIRVIHPLRVTHYGRWPLVLAAIWVIATAALIWPEWSDAAGNTLLAVSLGTASVLASLGLMRGFEGKPSQESV
ncbi:MAG: CDP-alcohol phosphatidyltransferase family protein [Sphingosinicella sp.]